MKRKQLSGGSSQEGLEECGSATYELSRMLKLGDFVWAKLDGSLWWPAQVVDANSVSETIKPRNRSVGEVLVRVYGSYTYLYMDPTKCRDEFEHVLEQNNGRHSAVFLRSLEQETISDMVSEELSARRKKVMQSLGLVPPSGSPFNKYVQR